MNREDSFRIIRCFISELDGTVPATAVPVPAPKQATIHIKSEPPVVAAAETGLGSLISECAGFEVSHAEPRLVAAPAPASGLGELIQGCSGFEIGATPSGHAESPSQSTAGTSLDTLIEGCSGFQIASVPAAIQAVTSTPTPAYTAAPSTTPAPPAAPADPDLAAIRKAMQSLKNKPLLASLLKYYLSEAQKHSPSLMMIRSTKDSIMKGWPQLVFSPLISALEGAIT